MRNSRRVRLSPAAGASSSGEDARPVTGTVLAARRRPHRRSLTINVQLTEGDTMILVTGTTGNVGSEAG